MKSLIVPTQVCPNLQPHWHLEQLGDRWELVGIDRRLPHPSYRYHPRPY